MTSPKRTSRPKSPSAKAPRPNASPSGTPSLTFSPEIAALLVRLRDHFAARGVEAYCVGGVVRDAISGWATADVDIALHAADVGSVAAEMARSFTATLVPLDEERQVFRVVPAGGAYIDLTPVRGGGINADLALRDFTIDALAIPFDGLDLAYPSLLDPLGGIADLRAGTVRACGPGVFREDPLRLLRGVRLAAEMCLVVEPSTQAMMREEHRLLATVTGERTRDEFCRILAAPGAVASLRLLDNLGLLTMIIPELEEARGVGQPKEHYWDVLQHSLETVGAMEQVLRQSQGDPQFLDAIPWNAAFASYFQRPTGGGRNRLLLAKLTALLHDISKPATKTVEPDGRIRFLGHPVKGAEVTEQIMERLRFTSQEVRMVSIMVEEHLRPGLISRGANEPTRRALYRFFRDAEDVVVDTLFLSFADYMAARGPLMETDDWALYSGKIRDILSHWQEWLSVPPTVKLVDGHDIMREFKLPPGPRIGSLLEAVMEGHASGEISSKEEALVLVGRLLHPKRGSAPARGKAPAA